LEDLLGVPRGHCHHGRLALVYQGESIIRGSPAVKDNRLYRIHIREAIERIEEYTQEGKDAFLEDHRTQDAVLRNLHTLAESTQRISSDLKAKHSG
jgi:hypothetical protein